MSYKAEVRIALKKGVADPEGRNTQKALELLGFQGLREVKAEKLFEIHVDAASEEVARHRAEEMCKRLLANPVIHEYTIRIERDDRPAEAPKPERKAKAEAPREAAPAGHLPPPPPPPPPNRGFFEV